MQFPIEIYQTLLKAEDSLTKEQFIHYEKKYQQLKKLIDYNNEIDLLALFRITLETKEKTG